MSNPDGSALVLPLIEIHLRTGDSLESLLPQLQATCDFTLVVLDGSTIELLDEDYQPPISLSIVSKGKGYYRFRSNTDGTNYTVWGKDNASKLYPGIKGVTNEIALIEAGKVKVIRGLKLEKPEIVELTV